MNNHQRHASRRDFLRVGSLAIGGLALGDRLRIESARAEQKWYDSKVNTARASSRSSARAASRLKTEVLALDPRSAERREQQKYYSVAWALLNSSEFVFNH